MKKRIYFIIASIISFLMSIYSICVSNETVKETIESLKKEYAGFPQDFQNRIIGMYEKSGEKLIILFAIIVIISSVILFIFAKNNTLIKHKGLSITLILFSLFFSDRLIIQLLAITSLIIMILSKRKNPEDFLEKSKKSIPKLKLDKISINDKILSILLAVTYFSQFIWLRFIPRNLTIFIVKEILFNMLMLSLSIIVFYNQLKNNLKIFKENIKTYMKFIMPRLGVSYLFLFTASIISTMITKNGTSVNQQNLESLPIFYTIFAAVIYAPIVEEIIFRGVLKRFIKNDVLFIVISAFSFGILHTIGESSILNIFVMSLPYASLGAYLAYIYTRTNNIFSSITSHAIFNTISSIFMLFL